MKRPVRLPLLLLLSFALFQGSSNPCIGAITNSVDKAIGEFDKAINVLNTQSQSWQTTLGQLEHNLIAEGESALANEVQNLAQRGIATAGTELRCNADFVQVRMRQALERIEARLRKVQAPPLTPGFCQVVPEAVDLRLDPSRRGQLSFYGYDMDAPGSTIQVAVQDANGETNVTQFSAMPTHYLLTINIASMTFPATSQKIIIRWGATVLSTINVIAVPPPKPPAVCSWSGWSCGQMECSNGQYLAGIDFNASANETCWGRGNDMDESNRRIKCCNLPAPTNSCFWLGWGCGIQSCPTGNHVGGVDFNANPSEGCWGAGNDMDEPNRRLKCCQTPSPSPRNGCFWSGWSCGQMECPTNFYISQVDFNADRNEDCWGRGNDMDEPTRRIECCPM